MKVTIYHNPRCSKSRATLALLLERGIQAEVIEYLDAPPDRNKLLRLLKSLNLSPRELLRTGEAAYKELDLGRTQMTDAEIIDIMVCNPILIERPIVVAGSRAAIGRPPERVLEIL